MYTSKLEPELDCVGVCVGVRERERERERDLVDEEI